MSLTTIAIKQIAKELQKLEQSPPEDIQVILNEDDLTHVQAWIRGPEGTPYEEGFFKIKLVMDQHFPQKPPKGVFLTKIFHPNVSETGEICVNTLKKDWKAELGIEHVLLTIKCLLIVPNPESALNEEAGKLLLEHYDDYAKRARLYTSIQAKAGKSEYMKLTTERVNEKDRFGSTEDEENRLSQKRSAQTNSDPVKKVKRNDKKKTLRRL
ncbi:Ubiquitin-conjugating enzyme E2 S [Choanephora cucurbitarum]|uniref:E2 ubiquitin-conjugating enzyme n=1 Tax=Choanephora cucurbitarum TaxID=101091 RepID=A0A1C7NBT6_9FUNG|nr:Ubiquitin-conjugating enzyme E2 S [Choanephora cucurbitarum]